MKRLMKQRMWTALLEDTSPMKHRGVGAAREVKTPGEEGPPRATYRQREKGLRGDICEWDVAENSKGPCALRSFYAKWETRLRVLCLVCFFRSVAHTARWRATSMS